MHRYSTGDWYTLVTAEGVAMLPSTVSAETVERTWQALAEGRGLAAVLEGMVGAFGTSLSALPPFALISRGNGDDEVRVAVRGPIEVRLDGPLGSTSLSGLGVTTWNERAVAPVSTVQAALPGAAAPFLPINDGVVLAGSLEFVPATTPGPPPRPQSDAAEEAAQASIWPPTHSPAPRPTPARLGPTWDEPPVRVEDLGEIPEPEADGTGSEDDAQAEAPGAPEEGAHEPEAPIPGEDSPEDANAQPAGAPAGGAEEAEAARPGDDSREGQQPSVHAAEGAENPGELESPDPKEVAGGFQPTGYTTVAPPDEPSGAETPADAGVSAPEGLAEPEETPPGSYLDLLYGDTVKSSVEEAAVRSPQGHTQPPDDSPRAIISGIPSFAAAAAHRPGDSGSLGDHDGETISLARLRAMQAVSVPQADAPPGAPSGIPPAATLVLSTGERVGLERGAVVGRRPRLVRVQGGSVPQLVTVPSPNQDISRSHLELRVEGTHLLAVDLDTTNGTRLLRPGMDPVRLQPGEPTMLVGGDRIDIGDGIELSFEGLR